MNTRKNNWIMMISVAVILLGVSASVYYYAPIQQMRAFRLASTAHDIDPSRQIIVGNDSVRSCIEQLKEEQKDIDALGSYLSVRFVDYKSVSYEESVSVLKSHGLLIDPDIDESFFRNTGNIPVYVKADMEFFWSCILTQEEVVEKVFFEDKHYAGVGI